MEARAITLDSLLKLATTKAADNKTTVLEYLVNLDSKAQKVQGHGLKQGSDALMFCDELKHLSDASKMLLTDLFSRAKKVGMFLNKVKRETKLCLECKSERVCNKGNTVRS